ncbi:hypothetical protein RJZ56_006383 [Blastomyces dermatitidis]|nr:extracellular serine-rich protein [Blastomyces dermatitidis ER-3]EEQ88967.1 extracellular serine-rich protein [Blastomyces dermatitidis ER-3]EGE82312.1 extracellular serine-rich protein [Blastomyces dermatitidis ATCC 18188]EQL32721.1 hypothetical protein BDFG_05111 [Blastomyces dermatitidis ATCC 26199]
MKSLINTIAFVAAASAATIDVKVGDEGLTFSPNTIRAQAGDDVVFHFFPRNHDVAAGPFDEPCTPSDDGLYSGLINIDGSQPDATFTVRINNTDPIWLYCSTRGHCQGGMSAVINPPARGKTLEAYQTASKNARSVRPEEVRGGIFRENGGANQSSSASGTPSSSPTGTATGTATGTGTATSTGAGGATTSPTSTPDAASSLFSEGTMVFNIFAAVVAGGVGFVGLL